jgi:hypothetical protein
MKRVGRPEVFRMLFTIPPDLRTWLEERAAYNLSPMNAVAIAALRKQMEAEQEDARAGRKTAAV